MPQFKVPLHGIDLHFLHVAGQGAGAVPLLLSHGWPGSVFEFLELIPRLTDPARFGGDPADAFTVVAPSLPGYGLSFAPGQPRFGARADRRLLRRPDDRRARLRALRRAGRRLGRVRHRRASAAVHADKLLGIHLNLLRGAARPEDASTNPTPEERRYLDELAHWLKEETGYQWIQGTRPQTLAFGLTDSPAGPGRLDRREVPRLVRLRRRRRERVRRRDQLLANISLYWFTGAIGSSFWPYYARMHGPWPMPDGGGRRADRLLPSSRARSCARRARSPSASTPTSGAGR